MLEKDVQYIKGVGPTRANHFRRIEINTLKDLIEYYPKGYEDRTEMKKIIEFTDDSINLVSATLSTNVKNIRTRKKLTIQKAIISDETGSSHVIWYNKPYLVKQLKKGSRYYFYGKAKVNGAFFELQNPEVEEADITNKKSGKILPIYRLTKGVTQNILRKIVENALNEINTNIDKTNIYLNDIYSKDFLNKNKLIDINSAINNIHFPKTKDMAKKAKRRLTFDELFITTLMLFKLKNENKKEKGPSFKKEVLLSPVIDDLPFKLTNAQIRVLNEIEDDLEKDKSMDRLLQGDVGSGKTIIAILSSYKAVKSGYQVAMLAPTAILVMQHFDNFKKNLEKYGIKIDILKSGLKKKEKEDILLGIKNGDIDIIIGTHALLEEDVEFNNLGLVITDEQHRFGVKQREAIFAKGNNPNTLVMSATPIPRTLALILYGDLDISIIDELPPNRKEIKTIALNYRATEKIYNFIETELVKGRQAYIVCPLIEENEELDLNSVEEIYEKYKNHFTKYNVSFMHGKMKDVEKDEIMLKFKQREIDILVSTTVIEVGVDVPNANIMVVENAERFRTCTITSIKRKSRTWRISIILYLKKRRWIYSYK